MTHFCLLVIELYPPAQHIFLTFMSDFRVRVLEIVENDFLH